MLCAIDQSVPSNDHAALSMDPSLAQPLIDCTTPWVYGFGAGRTDCHVASCVFMVASTVCVS